MVMLALHPRRSTTTDLAAPFMKLGYALAPRLTGRIAEIIFRSYFRRAAPQDNDTGNLFDSHTPLGSIEGGWRTPASRTGNLAGIGLLAAGALLSLLLAARQGKAAAPRR
jgi:hypothetical protein